MLQGHGLLMCTEDLVFVLLQLGCDEPLGVDQGLFAHVFGRDVGQLPFGYFEVVSEDFVEADLQRTDSRALALAYVKGRDKVDGSVSQ